MKRMIKRLLIAGGWVIVGIAITLLYCVLDDKVALYLCRKAEAQFNLGLCYANGDGMLQDKAEAVKWYRKAAEQGYKPAKEKLDALQK